MPLGYDKKTFITVAGQILIFSTVQLAFMGAELDSKFSISRTVEDKAGLALAIQRFRKFIFICIAWIILTGFYFLYSYGIVAMILYLILSSIILIYNASEYIAVFNLIKRKYNITSRIF